SARGLPGTVQGVVTSRLDRLTPEQQLSLKVGSVLGPRFTAELLEAVYPVPAESEVLAARLHQLEERGLIQLESTSGPPAWLFRHAITQEAVYATLPFSQRRELHHRAAEWYETGAGADDLPLLAYHWRRAEDRAKAGLYLKQAGERALKQYAHLDAIGFLTDALAISHSTDGAGPRARLELLLGRAYAAISSYAEDRRHLEAGLSLHGEKLPASTAGGVCALLREVVRQLLHRLRPATYVGRRSGERDALLERARALETLVETYFYLGDSLRSLYAAIRTLNLAEAAGDSPELARGYAILGNIGGFIPLPSASRWYGRRALEVVRATGTPADKHWVAIVVGVSRAGMGEWESAAELFDDARRITEGLGDRRRWADAVGNLALVHLFRGDVAEASRQLLALLESATRERDRRYQVGALRPLVWCLIAEGRLDEAAARLDELRGFLGEGL